MTIQQLTGRCLRLRQELEIACRSTPWQAAHIDRLAGELSATEDELGRADANLPPPEPPAPGAAA